MHIIDCALSILRSNSVSRAITDVVVSVSSIEAEDDRLESAIFVGAGDGARNMALILMTEEGLEYQIPIALDSVRDELELGHFWTNTQKVNVAVLPNGAPEPYQVANRTLPLESYFSETAAYDLAQAAR